VPLYAQDQQPNAAKLKETGHSVASSISREKAKIQAYCEITDLGEHVVEAAQEKNEKKADALMQRIDELEKILGPEYRTLFDALYEADPNSKDVQDILSMFDTLDESCPR
jgi:predicted ribosome quality control (RQC) complex YloA/Tae2 family protein